MNEELAKMNAAIEETRLNKLAAMKKAIFQRGTKRRISLAFVKVFEKLETWQRQLRDEIMRSDD